MAVKTDPVHSQRTHLTRKRKKYNYPNTTGSYIGQIKVKNHLLFASLD
jgi:hypothetical protein